MRDGHECTMIYLALVGKDINSCGILATIRLRMRSLVFTEVLTTADISKGYPSSRISLSRCTCGPNWATDAL